MSMHNYSGPLREDFQWHHLEKKTMARFAREVMLCNQIHDRALLPLVAGRWGAEAMTTQAINEWMVPARSTTPAFARCTVSRATVWT